MSWVLDAMYRFAGSLVSVAGYAVLGDEHIYTSKASIQSITEGWGWGLRTLR